MTKTKEDLDIISVCIELTDYCNIGCPYCLLENGVDNSSEAVIKNILDILFKYGVKRFTIGGGEPLEVSYLFNIGSYIKEQGYISLLRTSASKIINPDNVKSSFDLVDISVDSHRREILRKCKPYIDYDVVFQNITDLAKENIKTRCNILITKYNYKDIVETINFLNAKGIEDIRLQKLVPRGKAKRIYSELSVSNFEYRSVVNNAINFCRNRNIRVNEVKSVTTTTLCIIKPNGDVFTGEISGLKYIGSIFDMDTLHRAGSIVKEQQQIIYGDII
jgi:MoaA/NifB/PqqE/SkfB family radical SAM enzyme